MLALVQYHFLVLYTLTPQFSRIIVLFFLLKMHLGTLSYQQLLACSL